MSLQDRWDIIEDTLRGATAITFDGCHKIYVVLDEEQREKMQCWGYSMIDVGDDTDLALVTLQEWYEASCSLRFVQSVRTVEGDPNKGYVTLIPQFD